MSALLRSTRAYNFGKDSANIFLFDHEGKPRQRIDVTEVDYEIMNEPLAEIRMLAESDR